MIPSPARRRRPHLQPRAFRDEVAGLYGSGAVKVSASSRGSAKRLVAPQAASSATGPSTARIRSGRPRRRHRRRRLRQRQQRHAHQHDPHHLADGRETGAGTQVRRIARVMWIRRPVATLASRHGRLPYRVVQTCATHSQHCRKFRRTVLFFARRSAHQTSILSDSTVTPRIGCANGQLCGYCNGTDRSERLFSPDKLGSQYVVPCRHIRTIRASVRDTCIVNGVLSRRTQPRVLEARLSAA